MAKKQHSALHHQVQCQWTLKSRGMLYRVQKIMPVCLVILACLFCRSSTHKCTLLQFWCHWMANNQTLQSFLFRVYCQEMLLNLESHLRTSFFILLWTEHKCWKWNVIKKQFCYLFIQLLRCSSLLPQSQSLKLFSLVQAKALILLWFSSQIHRADIFWPNMLEFFTAN